MNDASMPDASFGSDAFGNGMADAGMGDAGMDADLGFDPALAAQALPGEQPLGPRRIPSIVTIGWLVLGLVVATVIGTLVLAPSAVMSVLPGAARLYALFGGRSERTASASKACAMAGPTRAARPCSKCRATW